MSVSIKASIFLIAAELFAFADGLTPKQALARIETAPGFEVKLVASEPEIRQPLSIYFDERGRMWVIQYLQYPAPNGLKPVTVDNYLRTTYDRVPEPPPFGPKGADRITICEDTDGDGRMDKFKDFVSDLNLCTGMAVGHGGVYVLQAPYLLFYPDKNRDDVPDGPPEVLLKGFGMEDAHALANSLQWGPDGWLYGNQGSTVTANINGIQFQQGIWRFHPTTHEFELFSEGGGNTWGLDFDADGNAIAGTNFGEVVALHQVQGAYYLKNFGKHGELHNPYAYGYFDHIPFKGFKGGHVTCGGIIYQGGLFPGSFDGTYIAANLLANTICWHNFTSRGSTFTGQFGGILLDAHDTWFRGVDCALGPDGAVYVADWYDKRATHVDPANTWDKSNGRIYRIAPKNAPAAKPFDLAELASEQLVEKLSSHNNWYAREARRILSERKDARIIPALEKLVAQNESKHLALEAFWALAVTTDQWKKDPAPYLHHQLPSVRGWAVRLLCDDRKLTDENEIELARMSKEDPSPAVRNQLACSVRRLSGPDANQLRIIFNLLAHDQDQTDQFIPMLLWWALEPRLASNPDAILQYFKKAENWNHAIVRGTILERLGRRLVATGETKNAALCKELVDVAPNADYMLLLKGIEKGVEDAGDKPNPIIAAALRGIWEKTKLVPLQRLLIRIGDQEAQKEALATIHGHSAPEAQRVYLLESLKNIPAESVEPLIQLLHSAEGPAIQAADIKALQQVNDPKVGEALLRAAPKLPATVRKQALAALGTRQQWAELLLEAVERGEIPSKEIPLDQVEKLGRFESPQLREIIQKYWGTFHSENSQEKASTINQMRLLVRPSGTTGRDSKGDLAAGKQVFTQTCAVCHTLFGQGNKIGPDLTSADRKNLDSLLIAIVTPSAYIRPEFASYELTTKDDQSFTGLMVESTAKSVTLLDANNQKQTFPRDQVKDLRQSVLSLMPEGILENLSQKNIIDLFTYLQSENGS